MNDDAWESGREKVCNIADALRRKTMANQRHHLQALKKGKMKRDSEIMSSGVYLKTISFIRGATHSTLPKKISYSVTTVGKGDTFNELLHESGFFRVRRDLHSYRLNRADRPSPSNVSIVVELQAKKKVTVCLVVVTTFFCLEQTNKASSFRPTAGSAFPLQSFREWSET